MPGEMLGTPPSPKGLTEQRTHRRVIPLPAVGTVHVAGGLPLTRAVAGTPAWELYTDRPAALSWSLPSLGVRSFPFKSGRRGVDHTVPLLVHGFEIFILKSFRHLEEIKTQVSAWEPVLPPRSDVLETLRGFREDPGSLGRETAPDSLPLGGARGAGSAAPTHVALVALCQASAGFSGTQQGEGARCSPCQGEAPGVPPPHSHSAPCHPTTGNSTLSGLQMDTKSLSRYSAGAILTDRGPSPLLCYPYLPFPS